MSNGTPSPAGPSAASRRAVIEQLTAPGQPYELIEIEGLRGPVRAFRNAPSSLRALYEGAVSDRDFLVFGDDRLTFTEALAASARLAHALVDDLGVRPGDRVAISMRNFPEWMLAFEAATAIGAIAVAMNSMWQSDEMVYGLRDSGAAVLFADDERMARLAAAPTDEAPEGLTVVAVRTSRTECGPHRVVPFTTWLPDGLHVDEPRGFPAADIRPDQPATILYTSGSTGRPKGVVSTHRNIVTALLAWELEGASMAVLAGVPLPTEPTDDPTEGDSPAALLGVPLFHVLGLHAVFLASFRARRKLVCMTRWDPAEAAALVERERITAISAPPAMTGDLVREARRTDRDLSSLRSVGGGGASRAPEQVRQIDDAFATAAPQTGWGMTETSAIGTLIGGADYLAHPGSAGRCLAVLDLAVVDDDGRPVPPGERGELLVRGTSLFVGYWNRPEVDAEVFVDGGWFRTGDVAIIDDEEYLYIVDRIKDLIIRGGENIGCGEVEAALLSHPDVREASVYAVPDERLGEEVGATVFVEGDLTADELRTFCAAHLAPYAVPRHLTITREPLPRTASGKIFRRAIRDAAVGAG
ncbi:MAG: class I adenylate-forming enzyme family protein [Acidimicrobiales bacterium]